MAWRPTEYLLKGELDNTTPGKVTGRMRFAGMDRQVTFNLAGDFHRDIRGAKIHFTGDGHADDPKAAGYMQSFGEHQIGKVGDITAGLPPQDYVDYPYIEWYSEDNGRVVLELTSNQIEVVGPPIPVCESDPVSRARQDRNMAEFLSGMSQELGVPAIAPAQAIVSDPAFTHWVVEQDHFIGEAKDVEAARNGVCFAFVRLFAMPECAELGSIEARSLQPKQQEVGDEHA